MIQLEPNIEISKYECPKCRSHLIASDWLIVGMRNLAEFRCSECRSEFYGDLPAGQALYSPMILDKNSGEVFDEYDVEWFSDWLSEGYANRTAKPIGFEVKKFSEPKNKIVFLNCLDTIYGHSLLKLLNAQYYIDKKPDYSLIVLIPKFFEWMLPEGIAEAWIVDLPLKNGRVWSDWLASEIKERLEPFSEVYLSVAFSHPHPEDFDIERFTRVKPFPLEDFGRHQNRPVVTFAWRNDRLWESANPVESTYFKKIKRRLRINPKPESDKQINKLVIHQTNKIIGFAESLRNKFPTLDFAVVGLGKTGDLPNWIADLRSTQIDEKTERNWCERYAKSHIIVGVTGSNMLLPSAHAASVIDLIGENWWGNFMQDILFRYADPREMFFRYRFVPTSTSPEELALLASGILKFEGFRRLMSPEFSRHQNKYDFEQFLSDKVK